MFRKLLFGGFLMIPSCIKAAGLRADSAALP